MLSIPSTKIPTFCDSFQVTILNLPGKFVSSAVTALGLTLTKQAQTVTSGILSRIDIVQGVIQAYGENCVNVTSTITPSRGIRTEGICDFAAFMQQSSDELVSMRNSITTLNFGMPHFADFSPFALSPQTAALLATTLVDSTIDFCALKANCKKNWVNLTGIELTKWAAAALVFSVSGVALQTGLLAYGASRTINVLGRWLYSAKEPSEKTVTVGSYRKSVKV